MQGDSDEDGVETCHNQFAHKDKLFLKERQEALEVSFYWP